MGVLPARKRAAVPFIPISNLSHAIERIRLFFNTMFRPKCEPISRSVIEVSVFHDTGHDTVEDRIINHKMAVTYDTPAGKAAKDTPLSARLVRSSRSRQAQDVIQIGGDFDQQLKISFQRTICVPDGKGTSALPPGTGTFPLYPVTQDKDSLPSTMSLKRRLFFLYLMSIADQY